MKYVFSKTKHNDSRWYIVSFKDGSRGIIVDSHDKRDIGVYLRDTYCSWVSNCPEDWKDSAYDSMKELASAHFVDLL